MTRLIVLLFALAGSLSAAAAEYEGTVGKMKAVFSLDWQDDGTVTGTYAYPDRPGTVYTLRGKNAAEGELYLEEYTGDEFTARCYLGKVITDGVIIWRGEMRNSDGRAFPMEFSRRRERAAPATPAPDGTRYSGQVGRLAATFALTWHEGGAVTGTYTYPDRPGTTYGLEGTNPREGELYLAEYTGEILTARCRLRKRIEEGEIVWEGEMSNLDGRRFPMRLSRTREIAIAAADTNMDTYDSERAAIRAKIRPLYRWDAFPLADQVVEMVPVHFPGAQHFNARVTGYRSDGDGLVLSFVVGEWDGQDHVVYENGPEVTLEMARPLPLEATHLVGSECSVVFAADGSLLTVDLCSVAATHARKGAAGKLEIRGLLEFWRDADSPGSPQPASMIELIPDKLALFDYGGGPDEDLFYQSIRLVKDYGITIQSTDAGSAMLELESLSLDPEPENPWIPLEGSGMVAPPVQQTGQAG
jgi:hypothetical protein